MKLIYEIPEKYLDDYNAERAKKNRITLQNVLHLLLFIQIIFLSMNLINPFTADQLLLTHYRTFYVVMIILNLISIQVLYKVKQNKIKSQKVRRTLFTLMILYIVSYGMGVAISDIFQGESIVVYYFVIISLSIAVDMKLWEYLAINIPVYLMFIYLLYAVVQGYFGYPIDDTIYAVTQFLLFGALLRYYINRLRTQNFLQRKQLEYMSFYDALTKLYNRRRWDELYNDAYEHAYKQKQLIGVIIIDVDYFKMFNDLYGHVIGDDVLNSISKVIEEECNKIGAVPGRYGGDEFIIFIPGKNENKIHNFSKSLLDRVKDIEIITTEGEVIKVTFSYGYEVQRPISMNHARRLIHLADLNLYTMKRNRTK
jgi:diguanylate cyclase (GGDEF)-like protein